MHEDDGPEATEAERGLWHSLRCVIAMDLKRRRLEALEQSHRAGQREVQEPPGERPGEKAAHPNYRKERREQRQRAAASASPQLPPRLLHS